MPHHLITDLLNAWGKGDKEALNELMEIVYPQLKAQARKAMGGERASHTLQPTALVNEVYLELLGLGNTSWKNRQAFFALSAKLMTRLLIDHAREASAQ
jgi:RNA polymerase sigma factor (TIGR02999 family)